MRFTSVLGHIARGVWNDIDRILIGVAIVALFALLAFPQPAAAADVVLPYLTVDGYGTMNVFDNTTGAEVSIDLFPDQSIGFEGKFLKIPAGEFVKRPSGMTGIGGQAFSLPDGVSAYSEITTPHQPVARIGKRYGTELVARDSFVFPDLQPNSRTNAGIFIIAKTDTSVTVPGSPTVPLRPGEGVILPAYGATSSVVTQQTQLGAGQVFAFAYINDPGTGSIQIVPAR